MNLLAGFWDDFARFWEDNDQWISAVATLALAFVLAVLVDRAFKHRAHRVAATVARGQLSRRTDTRLRFVRRVVYATILLIGVALALSQFTGVSRIAASVLASGVVAAAIVGFAARQTLANFVAGVMLAITQPIRIGDWVRFEDHYGEVVDVRLNYTVLRTAGDQRVLIPNEKLAGGVLTNDTLVVEHVGVDVSLWIPPGADAARAVELLREESGADVTIAEAVPQGVRLAVGGGRVPPHEKAAHEAEMRARCLARLQAEGLLEGFPPVPRT
jgi:small-conductance mechanosensitive channel